MAIAFSRDEAMLSIMVAEESFEVVEALPENRGTQEGIGFKEALNADLLESCVFESSSCSTLAELFGGGLTCDYYTVGQVYPPV
ncbi:hypothetical protein [Pacificibacter marinus]|uniref:Uncharacterized protein n=1 Tax=Pacificibacter marinus TaxID=658057 RepID=A0A1Y5TYP1_9RHOB|nr:hypothetical protein [Pacificibacter marinus]SEL41263.1 hypothetical protein SAMN04488032_1279 [Pacificibacter marinus]SLN71762.1 hypothetical protein PAM7971_03843 [Pacificibacter marinus]